MMLDAEIEAQAIQWCIELDDTLTPTTAIARLNKWLAEDPRHGRILRQVLISDRLLVDNLTVSEEEWRMQWLDPSYWRSLGFMGRATL